MAWHGPCGFQRPMSVVGPTSKASGNRYWAVHSTVPSAVHRDGLVTHAQGIQNTQLSKKGQDQDTAPYSPAKECTALLPICPAESGPHWSGGSCCMIFIKLLSSGQFDVGGPNALCPHFIFICYFMKLQVFMGNWVYLLLKHVLFLKKIITIIVLTHPPRDWSLFPALLSKVRFLWLRILIKNDYFWQQKSER